jgi:histidyl-tRNA synthetase
MNTINLNPLKGFRDLYPKDKAIQNYILDKLKETARFFGFEQYDGPLVESMDLYLEKSSRELVENQTFRIKSKKEEDLVMRPEMTPSLARMVAKGENDLTFPLKLFNLGLRFRYEAPQKGRSREFYQADFDILGGDSAVADAEILQLVITFFLNLGAKKGDFMLYINSRSEMQKSLKELGYTDAQYKDLLNAIDKQDKISQQEFVDMILKIDNDTSKASKLQAFLNSGDEKRSVYFKELFSTLESLYGKNVNDYCQVNYNIIRGLDYYTGLVFEVKELGSEMKRSLLGGGRYDNLISMFNKNSEISGVGFATSDVVLQEFLQDKNLVPTLNPKTTKFLVTIFSPELFDESARITQYLRKLNIATELYLDPKKKLDKQLKYANTNNIPYVIVIGPEEKQNNTVKIKNMATGDQKEIKIEEIISFVN